MCQARFNVAKSYTIDVDRQRTPFLCQRARQAEKSGFRGRIIGLSGGSAGRRNRRDIHHLTMNNDADFAFLPDAHIQKVAQLPKNAERRPEMHILDCVPLFVADFVQRPIPDVPSIVDHDVNVTEFCRAAAIKPPGKSRVW